MKYIGRTSQNSLPNVVSDSVALPAGYRPVIAAATGVPLPGSLSRASTHVTTVFGLVIFTLTQALGTSSAHMPARRHGHCPDLGILQDCPALAKVA
ncbi:hypothetical protein AB0B07_16800 [Streptomyces sioyaensis]|uniref:hypothetical protein n=1 Tax=Streptomyces sioyaensis TaxID=67364 RepID=UPI0033D02BB4